MEKGNISDMQMNIENIYIFYGKIRKGYERKYISHVDKHKKI